MARASQSGACSRCSQCVHSSPATLMDGAGKPVHPHGQRSSRLARLAIKGTAAACDGWPQLEATGNWGKLAGPPLPLAAAGSHGEASPLPLAAAGSHGDARSLARSHGWGSPLLLPPTHKVPGVRKNSRNVRLPLIPLRMRALQWFLPMAEHGSDSYLHQPRKAASCTAT